LSEVPTFIEELFFVFEEEEGRKWGGGTEKINTTKETRREEKTKI
jgi:hypothetical protein